VSCEHAWLPGHYSIIAASFVNGMVETAMSVVESKVVISMEGSLLAYS